MTHAWSEWEGRVVGGEFQLQKYLGGSERSAVFRTAQQGQEPQQAAIKLVPANTVNPELQLERWRLGQSLSHPHLIRIFQTGRCPLESMDLLFVVMEYAEENLGQILPERLLTPEEVSQMLEPALNAVAYLHSQGLVHGGLRPANIMAIQDQLKLASDVAGKAGESLSGPASRHLYGPPEQRTSPAADMWALGMTLAEALTQRLPSWEEQSQTDPALPAGISAPFSEIVRGCLRRDPRQRFTIGDIAARLGLQVRSYSAPPAPALTPMVSAPSSTSSPVPSAEARRVRQPKKSSKSRLIVLGTILIAVLAVLLRLMSTPANRKDASTATQPNTNGQPVVELRQSSSPPQMEPSPAPSGSEAPATTTHSGPAEGEVVQRVLPDVSPAAQATIQGTVKVRIKVQVDPAGNVVGTGFDSTGPSEYFSRLSLKAAQGWKFAPSDQEERREFLLRFDFTNRNIKASVVH